MLVYNKKNQFKLQTLFSVAYSRDHLDFKWKIKDPVNIFSDEMAEFDLTNTELVEKHVSYVSGKLDPKLHFQIDSKVI